jgi:hypothetical protein
MICVIRAVETAQLCQLAILFHPAFLNHLFHLQSQSLQTANSLRTQLLRRLKVRAGAQVLTQK